MSKQDQAAKIIRFGAARGYTPEQTATLLNELNLLATDLPEPHREVALHTPEWFLDGPISLVVSEPSEGVVFYGSDVHNGAFRLVLTKEEAEGIALALLAAANYSEEA